MRVTVVLVALVVSVSSALALESSITVKSPLAPNDLWKTLGDFCGITAWNPAVSSCYLSADGRQRTVNVYGTSAQGVAELENWDDARRTYSFRGISGLLPVSNYRGTVSVIEEGAGSALMLAASYDASGVSDAEAKKIIDGNLFFSLCIASPLACTNDQRPVPAAERVDFEGTSLTGRLMLKGYLRRPAGAGPFPAVVLLPGCGGSAEPLDQNWGVRLAEWGYVTLTVDSLSPRRLKNICSGGGAPDMQFDAYRALDFLAGREFVDAGRVAVLGFSYGGFLSLSAVERGPVEHAAKNKFRAAAAFYPRCLAVKGPLIVPGLIMIGDKDEWTPADACRKLANGEDDLGMSRQKDTRVPLTVMILAGAYHGFDIPAFERPFNFFGHRHEYNKAATDQSSEALRDFLASNVSRSKQQ